MKNWIRMLNTLWICIFACGVWISFASADVYQDEEPFQTRISVNCIQSENGQVRIEGKLRYRQDRRYINAPEETLRFYMVDDEGEIEIGSGLTDEEGNAEVILGSFEDFNMDEDSFYNAMVVFDGSEGLSSSDGDMQFRRGTIKLDFNPKDTLHTISVKTFRLDGQQSPIGDQDVFIMVPRMFSNLTVWNDYSDESGMVEMEFPKDIPGDNVGNLEVIVQIPDTDEYGTLEARINVPWGIPTASEDSLASGELWSPDPPLWMLITFAILMTLVWGHFIVITYKLYLINKEGMAFRDNNKL